MSEVDPNVSQPGVTATPTTPSTPAPATSGTPVAQPTTSAAPVTSPAPTGSQPPATGGPEGWVPSYRIRETREAVLREAQQAWQQRETAYAQRMQQLEQQLQALVGVTPQQTSEEEVIRQQFAKVFPELAQIAGKAKDLEALIEKAEYLEQQNRHYWNSYARNNLDRLYSKASESYGGPIDDNAKDMLRRLLIGYLESSPELEARYESDPTVIDEFWKAFSSGFIDPARRAATVTAAGRAPSALPQDTPGGAPQATPAPKLGGIDERANAAWTFYQNKLGGGV